MPNDAPDWTSFVQSKVQIANAVLVPRDGNFHTLPGSPFTLPKNTGSLEFVWDSSLIGLTVIGAQSGINWAYSLVPLFTSLGQQHGELRVDQSIDQAVTINAQFANVGGNAQVWVSAHSDSNMVTPDSGQAGATVITGSTAGQVVGLLTAIGPGNFQNLQATLEGANPADWQAAFKSLVTPAGFALAGGTSHVIIPGVGLRRITILALDWIEAVSASVNVFEDTTSAVQVGIDVPASRGGSNTAFIDKSIDGAGVPLPFGAGFQIRNLNATATATIWVAVRYSQQ